jgi:hypothetical protein
MTSIEQKILIAVADLDPDADRLDCLRRLVSDEVDADGLIDLAVKEGMGGLLYRNLQKAGALDRLGLEHCRKLESIYYQTVRLNLKLLHELKEILHQLNKNKIRVVLMQGISLLQQVYEDIGLRPMVDMDLWVLPEDYPALIVMLNVQGYQKYTIYPNTFNKGEVSIDIHTHFLWADRIKARSILLNKNQQYVYRNTRSIDVEGHKALSLNPYDQVLYLSLHTIKHYAERLIWLVDIKSMIKEWNRSQWIEFIKRAAELGLENILRPIIFLLKAELGYQPSPEAQTVIKDVRPNFLEKKVLKKRKKLGALPRWSTLMLLPGGKGLRQRLAYIFEELFPRPDILRQVFAHRPGLKVWQLYWRRSLQLIGLFKQ